MKRTATLQTDLSGLSYREYVGVLCLSLSAWGEYPGVYWAELAQAVDCCLEERKWAAVAFLSGIMDDLAGGRNA